jgi:hypothetical protein
MGEPPFPPIFGALANALYKATGKRVYRQPFLEDKQLHQLPPTTGNQLPRTAPFGNILPTNFVEAKLKSQRTGERANTPRTRIFRQLKNTNDEPA